MFYLSSKKTKENLIEHPKIPPSLSYKDLFLWQEDYVRDKSK